LPIWHLAGLVGSSAWALWVIALGVAVLRRRVSRPLIATRSDHEPRPELTHA
jgi:hypothetical protein